jgi:hypothetical protein
MNRITMAESGERRAEKKNNRYGMNRIIGILWGFNRYGISRM